MRTLLVVVLLGMALVTSCTSPEIGVDQSVRDTAPEPSPDRGPAAGQFERSWQSDVDIAGGATDYLLIAGNLLVVGGNGIRAVDPATGKPSWHYVEAGRELSAWIETDGVLALSTNDHAENEHLVGLDAGTGKRLWERPTDWEPLTGAAGTVLMKTPDDEHVGIDVRTGEDRWHVDERAATGDCGATSAPSPGPATLVLAELECKYPLDTLAALDTATGKPRWRRPLGELEHGRATIRDGFTLFKGEARTVLIDRDGRDLYTVDAAKKSLCDEDFRVERDRVLLDCGGDGQLISIDSRTGTVSQLPQQSGFTDPALRTVAGGNMFDLQPGGTHIDGLFVTPATLTVTDLASGDTTHAALPSTIATIARQGEVTWLGVAGDLLLIASDPGPTRLTAYALRSTTQPTELGGVSPHDWPDACALAAGLPSQELKPEPMTIGNVTINASCETSPGGIIIQIAWVAPTEEDAAELFGDGEPSTVGADEESRVDGSYGALLRVGRTIVRVQAYSPQPVDEILRVVVANLH